MNVSTIGLDLAKNVFQVHGVDEQGKVLVRRQLRRQEMLKFFGKLQSCVVGMEACASANYWGRELAKLGHTVRLIPPSRVKPFVKWGKKNDAVDAEAICEAVQRPNMQFVPIKTVEQQSAMMLHRVRHLLVRQRTMLINALRAHMAELGISAAKGDAGAAALISFVTNEKEARIPDLVRRALQPVVTQIAALNEQAAALERQIIAWHRGNTASRLLATIPQIGPIIASAIVATVGDASRFKSGRQFAAWIGLVPIQNSSGGKERLGGITKAGDKYLRQLLVLAATGMTGKARAGKDVGQWYAQLLDRKPPKVAAVALANKLARTAWAMLVTGECYRAAAASDESAAPIAVDTPFAPVAA
jgi:transposase